MKTPNDDRPNQKELMDRIAADLFSVLQDEGRKERSNDRVGRVLFEGIASHDGPEPTEELSADEKARYRLIEPYLALAQMPFVVGQCEFYFRRFPFKGLGVTRSDHLRNVCEMYFDRVIQFRDRLKRMLTVCRDDGLIDTAQVGRSLKVFDRVFAFEHRYRNQTHHAARFDYTGLSRLGMVELIGDSFPDELRRVLEPKALYRKEAKDWVQRVKSRTKMLEEVVEQVAGILLQSPSLPPRAKGRQAAKAKAARKLKPRA